jgi:hypothetical protein
VTLLHGTYKWADSFVGSPVDKQVTLLLVSLATSFTRKLSFSVIIPHAVHVTPSIPIGVLRMIALREFMSLIKLVQI